MTTISMAERRNSIRTGRWKVGTHGDFLIRVAQHGNEHVKQNYDDNSAVGAKHKPSNEVGKRVRFFKLKMPQIYESKSSKVEGLNDLP